MKICVAGQGAFGQKHLAGLARIDGVEVVSLAGGSPDTTEAVARKFGIPHWTTDLAESLGQPGVEAAILTTPTQMHADQAEQCMRAGKHVEVEIPMADSLADSERLVRVQEGNRAGSHGRAHAPFQSQPPVDPAANPGRRTHRPADGRADLFFPAQEHQRRRQAAKLDRPPALAPRLPYRGPVPVPDGRRSVRGLCPVRARCTRNWASPWT